MTNHSLKDLRFVVRLADTLTDDCEATEIEAFFTPPDDSLTYGSDWCGHLALIRANALECSGDDDVFVDPRDPAHRAALHKMLDSYLDAAVRG